MLDFQILQKLIIRVGRYIVVDTTYKSVKNLDESNAYVSLYSLPTASQTLFLK